MIKTRTLATLALAAFTAATNADVLVGPITNPANGHQYILLTQNSWTASQAEAVALGGNLVTINDQAEQDWVFDVFARAGGSGRGLWIGLSRSSASDPFRWASGEAVTYTNWAPGEPNWGMNRPEYTLMLATLGNTSLAGLWNNDVDNSRGGYIGFSESIPEFPIHGVVEIVPSPSALALLGLGLLPVASRRRK